MKTEGFEGFARRPARILSRSLAVMVAASALTGCASSVIMPDGSKMSEAVYAHRLSVEAYEASTRKAESCDYAAAGIGDALGRVAALLACGQRTAGNGGAQVPTYQAPPTAMDRVFQAAPFLLGVGNLWAGIRANDKQNETAVLLAAENTKREVGLMTAATGSNERIATGGFNAVSTVATAGFNALRDSSTANTAASAQNAAANAAALAAATAKPTTQITVGGNYTQAGRDIDQSVTGRNRLQDSAGAEVEVIRPIICNATGGPVSAVLGGLTASTTGITSALNPGYNPVVRILPARTSNNCGGG